LERIEEAYTEKWTISPNHLFLCEYGMGLQLILILHKTLTKYSREILH
jgi:hypothetical protein